MFSGWRGKDAVHVLTRQYIYIFKGVRDPIRSCLTLTCAKNFCYPKTENNAERNEQEPNWKCSLYYTISGKEEESRFLHLLY